MNTHFCRFALSFLLLLPVAARAQFSYVTNNGAITITQYTGSGGDVVIPDTITGLKVTTVGSSTFFQVQNLTSVTFSTNVTTIADNAIFQNPNLTAVALPPGVTNIGTGPVIDCQSLTTITLAATNTHYAVTNNILFNKTFTTLIEFPGGVHGSYTVTAGVTNTGQAFIGNTLNAIAADSTNVIYSATNGVFFNKNKSQLIAYPGSLAGSYVVPTNVSIIVGGSFEYSLGLTTVSIGTSVTNIGPFAFYDCQTLTSITVNPANAYYTTVNGVLFNKNQTLLIQFPSGLGGDYTVPASVANLGDGAFGDAFNLTSIVIGDNVTNIGFETFYSCVGLTGVSLGSKLTTIGQAAFFFCESLPDIVFPASVTKIGFEAFAGCFDLSGVCFSGNAPVDGGSIFFGDNSLSSVLYVSTRTGWGSFFSNVATEPCTTCGTTAPVLAIAKSGANVILSWDPSFTGYTLQSITNPAGSWLNLSGQFSVTNPITGTQKYYRLMGP